MPSSAGTRCGGVKLAAAAIRIERVSAQVVVAIPRTGRSFANPSGELGLPRIAQRCLIGLHRVRVVVLCGRGAGPTTAGRNASRRRQRSRTRPWKSTGKKKTPVSAAKSRPPQMVTPTGGRPDGFAPRARDSHLARAVAVEPALQRPEPPRAPGVEEWSARGVSGSPPNARSDRRLTGKVPWRGRGRIARAQHDADGLDRAQSTCSRPAHYPVLTAVFFFPCSSKVGRSTTTAATENVVYPWQAAPAAPGASPAAAGGPGSSREQPVEHGLWRAMVSRARCPSGAGASAALLFANGSSGQLYPPRLLLAASILSPERIHDAARHLAPLLTASSRTCSSASSAVRSYSRVCSPGRRRILSGFNLFRGWSRRWCR